ncbi:hypothetical protein GPECTOR_2g1248 [Gonium pectorale]|uniref:Uncharacterized protein n=1 Tax=Gonium pectorale TaxID=33097 RepID=A0A150H1F5_GONPE|nr:hypothetical protein GPECTOR_2g1248 [Gonium pectorale]|eukprot:KXZ55698.1 hypothetical protein GPECTOR_2g1248 [Gonium pectorale]
MEGGARSKREPIVWNPAPLPAAKEPAVPAASEAAAPSPTAQSPPQQHVQQHDEDPQVEPLSPSPRRNYSSSDSEPTRSRSRGYNSSDDEDDAAGREADQATYGGEGEYDHDEPLDEYFNMPEDLEDLLDEPLDEHVRHDLHDGDGGDAAGTKQDVQAGGGEGGSGVGEATGKRERCSDGGRVAYEEMGAPGPDLSRQEQVAHVTAGLVGQVGEKTLAKLRKLLQDMPSLNLSTIDWSTANNPGGVLHSRLQRAVEMERLALQSGNAARSKRARSASPGTGAPVSKRQEREAAADGRQHRSRSRERDARSREQRDTRDAKDRDRSVLAGSSRRDAGRDAAGRDGDRDGRSRNGRDAAAPRLQLREPDVKSRRWDDVVRATTRGSIAKLPRQFIEDARRILWSIDDLDCSQIDANAWEPLLMLPNCEQRLNALRALSNIRWKERFNVSATVKGTLLRCAEQVSRVGAPSARSASRPRAEEGAAGEDVGTGTEPGAGCGDGFGADGSGGARPLTSEFKDRMYAYLKGFGKLNLKGVDEKVFNCLGRLPDDGARMDCLRRLSGVQWNAVSGAQETQQRLRALLERGTSELLKGVSAPAKKGHGGSYKRRSGMGPSGRR